MDGNLYHIQYKPLCTYRVLEREIGLLSNANPFMHEKKYNSLGPLCTHTLCIQTLEKSNKKLGPQAKANSFHHPVNQLKRYMNRLGVKH